MNELDKQIEYWKIIYLDTYAQGTRKFAKWKFVGENLPINDLVLVVDHINPEIGHCSIGRVMKQNLTEHF